MLVGGPDGVQLEGFILLNSVQNKYLDQRLGVSMHEDGSTIHSGIFTEFSIIQNAVILLCALFSVPPDHLCNIDFVCH